MSLEKSLSQYRGYEVLAHVSLDDVLNKVTQETWEMVEAQQQSNLEETRKEAADAIVNVLSVASALWFFPEESIVNQGVPRQQVSVAELIIHLSKWNQDVQWHRRRYARNFVNHEEVAQSTNVFLSDLLGFADPTMTLEDIVRYNTAKFASRVENYKQDIDLYDYVTNFPDFPKKNIQFKDVSPQLYNPEVMRYIAFEMAEKAKNADIIAWLDARWFLYGVMVSQILHKPFVMVRKKGKLPWETMQQWYTKEYWEDIIEVQKDRILPWQKVAIIDDLLATGGTMKAAAELIEKTGGEVDAVINAIQLNDEFCAWEREKIGLHKNYNVQSIMHYGE